MEKISKKTKAEAPRTTDKEFRWHGFKTIFPSVFVLFARLPDSFASA
jgi:hypothetical protein